MKRHLWIFSLATLWCSAMVAAQGVTRSSATGQLTAYDTRSAVVPAGSSSTLLTFTIEGDTTGSNLLDVVTSDPSVVVSLIPPTGAEIANANAASFGFIFTVVTDGSYGAAEIPSAFAFPGTHTSIQIPAGQVSGIYQVKANASAASADSGIMAIYLSSSTVGVAATTNAPNYSMVEPLRRLWNALPQDVLGGTKHTSNGEWKTVFGHKMLYGGDIVGPAAVNLFRRAWNENPMLASDHNGPG